MKTIPIPSGRTVATSPDAKIRVLEGMADAIRRNIEALSKRSLDERNFANESIQLRHCSEELYGDADDLTNLRFGAAEVPGTVLGPFAPADHKHRLDPLLLMERSDPAQLTADTNDWALGTDNTLYFVDADAARNVTGIADGADGRFLLLSNDGTFTITFKHQDAGSLAANRFLFSTAADVTLPANKSIFMFYDLTALRWRDLSLPSSSYVLAGSGGLTAAQVMARIALGI